MSVLSGELQRRDCGLTISGIKCRAFQKGAHHRSIGGEIDPAPAGFREVIENYQLSPENTYHLEADTANTSEFSGEATSVTVHVTQADGTAYEVLLDTVTTPRTGVRRYSGEKIVEFGTTIMPPGELHTVEFELSDGSMVDLHTGVKMSVITDDAVLSAERAEVHAEVQLVEEQTERNESRIEQLEAGLHHEATNTRLIRRIQASTILPAGDTNVEWMDWFDGTLYLISPAHANLEALSYYPDGGATSDGLHWYFAQGRYLRSHDVLDPDSGTIVEAEWQAEGATERSYGLAVDSEYAGDSVADTLWQLITNDDDVQIVSRTPSTGGAMAPSQTFDITTAAVNTALGADFDDLATVSNDGSDRLGAIDIAVRGSDLFLLIHAELTEGSHTVPVVLPWTIAGTGAAKTLTVDGDSKRIITAVGEVKSFVEGDNNELYVCNEDIVYEFEEIGSSNEVPVPAIGDEQRILRVSNSLALQYVDLSDSEETGAFSGEVLYTEDERDQTGGNALVDDTWVTLEMTRAPAEHSRIVIRFRTDHDPLTTATLFTWVDAEEIDTDIWAALELTDVSTSATNLTADAIEATMARRASTTIGDTALTILTAGKVSDTEMCLLVRNASEFNPCRIQIIEELPISGQLASAASALAAGAGLERRLITPSPNPYPLTVTDFSSGPGWPTVFNAFGVENVPKDRFMSMVLIVDVNSRFDIRFDLDRFDLIENIGFTDQQNFGLFDDSSDNRIPAVHWAGGGSSAATKYPIDHRPRYGFAAALRSAGAIQVIIVFKESTVDGVEVFTGFDIIGSSENPLWFRGGEILLRDA